MILHEDVVRRRTMSRALMLAGATLALTFMTCSAIAQSSEAKPAEQKPDAGSYQTFYLTNSEQHAANDIQTDLRNMIPRAKIYYVPSQGALSVQGSAEDVQLAKRILSEIDRPKTAYRLTYTLTETDGARK